MRARQGFASALIAALISAAVTVTALPATARPAIVEAAAKRPASAHHRNDGAVSHPRRDPYYPAEGSTGLDALHYGLHLRWFPKYRSLQGTTDLRFRATRTERSVTLDLGIPLRADAIRLDGHPVADTHTGIHLVIETGRLARNSRHTLRIRYQGHPAPTPAPTRRSDIAELGWTTTATGQVSTVQEPFGAFTWYPVNDHPSDKAFYDATISAPGRWTGVFNGKLVSKRHVAGRTLTRFHLGDPAASYLTTIAIGPYARYTQQGPHGLPLRYWVRPVDRSSLASLHRSPALLRFLEARLGPFPFGRAGAVIVPYDTAEETQTLITMNADVFDFGVADLLHEYAHQWYGDDVTPDNWKDLWLNESFAQFLEYEWLISQGANTRRGMITMLTHEDQKERTVGGPPGEYHRGDFADFNVYNCGALMLFHLQDKLGPSDFAMLLRRWPSRHHFGNAHRREWIHFLYLISGRHLRPYVHAWLTSTTTPAH